MPLPSVATSVPSTPASNAAPVRVPARAFGRRSPSGIPLRAYPLVRPGADARLDERRHGSRGGGGTGMKHPRAADPEPLHGAPPADAVDAARARARNHLPLAR